MRRAVLSAPSQKNRCSCYFGFLHHIGRAVAGLPVDLFGYFVGVKQYVYLDGGLFMVILFPFWRNCPGQTANLTEITHWQLS